MVLMQVAAEMRAKDIAVRARSSPTAEPAGAEAGSPASAPLTVPAPKGVAVEEVAVDSDPVRRIEMVQRTGRRTVPQIFIGETHIGGFEEMAELDHKGELDPLLAEAPRSAS